jgi:hypothetical protein
VLITPRLGITEPADVDAIAQCRFERRRRHLDRDAAAVLPTALALLTHCHCDLIRRTATLWRRRAIDHHARERS